MPLDASSSTSLPCREILPSVHPLSNFPNSHFSPAEFARAMDADGVPCGAAANWTRSSKNSKAAVTIIATKFDVFMLPLTDPCTLAIPTAKIVRGRSFLRQRESSFSRTEADACFRWGRRYQAQIQAEVLSAKPYDLSRGLITPQKPPFSSSRMLSSSLVLTGWVSVSIWCLSAPSWCNSS